MPKGDENTQYSLSSLSFLPFDGTWQKHSLYFLSQLLKTQRKKTSRTASESNKNDIICEVKVKHNDLTRP